MVIVVIVSFIVIYILFTLIEKISHNVKFFLILALLILAYVIAKKFHLSALIIIFFFGLFMANTRDMLPDKFKKYIPTKKVNEGLHEFHLLTAESTFLIRTGFFLFFGFNITLDMFSNTATYLYGLAIIGIIFFVRFGYFAATQPRNILPTASIAPRGLITILLFLDLPLAMSNDFVNEKVLLIVILLSMLIMLLGLILTPENKETKEKPKVDMNTFGDV
ncbi:cation:proton antiporter [Ornithobacterium rhinotracheale]